MVDAYFETHWVLKNQVHLKRSSDLPNLNKEPSKGTRMILVLACICTLTNGQLKSK